MLRDRIRTGLVIFNDRQPFFLVMRGVHRTFHFRHDDADLLVRSHFLELLARQKNLLLLDKLTMLHTTLVVMHVNDGRHRRRRARRRRRRHVIRVRLDQHFDVIRG